MKVVDYHAVAAQGHAYVIGFATKAEPARLEAIRQTVDQLVASGASWNEAKSPLLLAAAPVVQDCEVSA